jgi:hypothetical protein
MSIYDAIANPQRSGIGEAAFAGRDQRQQHKKEKTLMEIIDSTKDMRIKSENAQAQASIDKAEADKRLADKVELSNSLQGVKDGDDYRNRIDTYFSNRYPNMPEEDKIGELKKMGLGATFDSTTQKALLNLDREVVNDVEQRQRKELMSYEARLKLTMEGTKEDDGFKFESPRAKLAQDAEVARRRAESALAQGDTGTASFYSGIADATTKALRELERKEQADAWTKQSEERDVSLSRIYPEYAAAAEEDYKGPAFEKQSLDTTAEFLRQQIELTESYPAAELATQREFVLDRLMIEENTFSANVEQYAFRRRTKEEKTEFDKQLLVSQPDADTASEYAQVLQMLLSESKTGQRGPAKQQPQNFNYMLDTSRK